MIYMRVGHCTQPHFKLALSGGKERLAGKSHFVQHVLCNALIDRLVQKVPKTMQKHIVNTLVSSVVASL